MKTFIRSSLAAFLLLLAVPIHAAPSAQAVRAIEEEISMWLRNGKMAGAGYQHMSEQEKSSGFGKFILFVGAGCMGLAVLKALSKPVRNTSEKRTTTSPPPTRTQSPDWPAKDAPLVPPDARQGPPPLPPQQPR